MELRLRWPVPPYLGGLNSQYILQLFLRTRSDKAGGGGWVGPKPTEELFSREMQNSGVKSYLLLPTNICPSLKADPGFLLNASS